MKYHLHLQTREHLSAVSEDSKEITWEQPPFQAVASLPPKLECAGECCVGEDAAAAQGAGTAQVILSLGVPSPVSACWHRRETESFCPRLDMTLAQRRSEEGCTKRLLFAPGGSSVPVWGQPSGTSGPDVRARGRNRRCPHSCSTPAPGTPSPIPLGVGDLLQQTTGGSQRQDV